MKKHLFIIILTILSSFSYAQLVDGSPFNFSSLNATQYNPGYHPLEDNPSYSNMWVTTREDIDLSESERIFLQMCFEDDYPGHTILAPPTVSYNCHGYSHSISQGGEICNVCWFSELCNNGFVIVQTPEKDDIAVIRTIDNNQFVPASIHSSIVVNEDTLISKWGVNALTKHHKYDVIGFTQVDTVNVYTYYRRVINTNSMISGPSSINGSGTYTFTPNVTPTNCTWSVEPADMFQVSSGSGYTANLTYNMPFVYLAPKATLSFTFSYGCENHYTATKDIDLYIPSTTISGNVTSSGFILDANAVVTVTGTIKNNNKAKTIVPIGTKLIINGGTMTDNGNGMWSGIEVWGDSSTHQYQINGGYGQGYLELNNGAVIENARCAVELWRPGFYSATGGIIQATDATFRNNTKAIHALWYTNLSYLNGKEMPYNSYFHNCSFLIDEDYMGLDTFYKHVDMVHVYGINFLGCDFSVNRHVSGVSPWCVGIGAYEAGFIVDSYCENTTILPCLEEYLIPSSFSGFYRGIHASNDGTAARTFSVKNSVFNNNTCGIYALNTGYATVVNNDFTVGCGSDCDFGIYADEVSGFCFEENIFHPKTNNMGSPYGIVIANSNGTNDVYRNTFANLSCGNVAIGNNIGNAIPVSGLTYTCNTNTGNAIDFCVLKDGNVGGIASSQGSPTMPAGNTFGGSQYHFYNDGNQVISYYYDSNEPDQVPVTSLLYQVSTSGIQSSNNCRSHYGNGGSVVKSASEKAALESDYLSALSTYSNLLQLYESRIDGGNTPTQVADIRNATPSDMWRLRAQLLGLSPYVSGEVLTTAADRNEVFTDPVLFEILAANPDELKKDTLINYLENKDNPLPAYMIDLLRQIAEGFTVRTALQAQITQYNHAYSLAAGDIVRSNLNDTVADLTELRTWLGNMGDIASDRMIVASYLQEGDSANAFALAGMLPELYGLQGDALSDHEDYMRLITLHQTLGREHRTSSELTEVELMMVDSIATLGIGTSKAMAEAILMERSGEFVSSQSCPTMPDNEGGNREKGSATDTSMNEAMGFTIEISPNPATTWTTVEFALPSNKSRAAITITNAFGVTMMSTELNGKQGQKVLDLRGLADGVYVYTVSCEEYMHSGKLIVTK